MTETATMFDRLISTGVFDTAKANLTKPEKNFVLLGPEGSGLEELLANTYTQETRNAMFQEGYLVTAVREFSTPETPQDVFKTLYRDARNALDAALSSNLHTSSVLTALSAQAFSDELLNSFDLGTAKSTFDAFVTQLKTAGYTTIFVYTEWERLVFPDSGSVKKGLNEIYGALRAVSQAGNAFFVVTTPYGLVYPNPLVQSDFIDSFRPFWTFPKLTCAQMRSLIEPFLQPDWPYSPEDICNILLFWTGGNLKLTTYFLQSLRDHSGDLVAMEDDWYGPTTTDLKTHCNHMMERWCSYLDRLAVWNVDTILHTVVTQEQVFESNGLSYLEQIGLISYDEANYTHNCCEALALYVESKHSITPEI